MDEDEVTRFLERIFLANASLEDEDEGGPQARARFLASARAPALTKIYRAIGGSPLMPQLQEKRQGLEEELGRRSLEIPVTLGTQFLTPSISDAVEQKSNPDVELNSFLDFVNSDEMLDFVRTITQMKEIKFADCQATLYRPGHFLRAHNDDIEHAGRLLAYTFNFTPHWDTDYGGILQFLDEEGDVDEGYSPKFNALNLFKIPTRHCVSYVTPFAAVGRYSLIGWFRK